MNKTLAAALIAPTIAFAASDESTPVTPTETTTACSEGTIWDETTKSCVSPKESRLDDDALFRAARELAHADRYQDALSVLAEMKEGESDRVLTYLGFVYRKMGKSDEGFEYYAAALAKNPDNILARSYLGQGLALVGDYQGARAQLSEIRGRGGRGTWAEVALRLSIEIGGHRTY